MASFTLKTDYSKNYYVTMRIDNDGIFTVVVGTHIGKFYYCQKIDSKQYYCEQSAQRRYNAMKRKYLKTDKPL